MGGLEPVLGQWSEQVTLIALQETRDLLGNFFGDKYTALESSKHVSMLINFSLKKNSISKYITFIYNSLKKGVIKCKNNCELYSW